MLSHTGIISQVAQLQVIPQIHVDVGPTFSNGAFPGGSDDEESAGKAGDPGLIPGSARGPEGTGYPVQCSCLENSMGRGLGG